MATFPLATGARMLGIHPKTLHHWLTAANLPLSAHPTDARIKCVAQEHLLEMSRRHDRPLLALAEAPGSHEEQAGPASAYEAELNPSVASMPTTSPPEADLMQKLFSLETKISTLQEQLAQLALALLQEREQRISSLESFLHSERPGQGMPQQGDEQGTSPGALLSQGRSLHPADQRARSRVTAMVEYNNQGRYVLMCPHEGELEIAPEFVAVVRLAGLIDLFPLYWKIGSLFGLPRISRERPNALLDSLSLLPSSHPQALYGHD